MNKTEVIDVKPVAAETVAAVDKDILVSFQLVERAAMASHGTAAYHNQVLDCLVKIANKLGLIQKQ